MAHFLKTLLSALLLTITFYGCEGIENLFGGDDGDDESSNNNNGEVEHNLVGTWSTGCLKMDDIDDELLAFYKGKASESGTDDFDSSSNNNLSDTASAVYIFEFFEEFCEEADTTWDFLSFTDDTSDFYSCTFAKDTPLPEGWDENCEEGYESFTETDLLASGYVQIGCMKEDFTLPDETEWFDYFYDMKYCDQGDSFYSDFLDDGEDYGIYKCIIKKDKEIPAGWDQDCPAGFSSFKKDDYIDSVSFGCIKEGFVDEGLDDYYLESIFLENFCPVNGGEFSHVLEEGHDHAFGCLVYKTEEIDPAWKTSCPSGYEVAEFEPDWDENLTFFGCKMEGSGEEIPQQEEAHIRPTAPLNKEQQDFKDKHCKDKEEGNMAIFHHPETEELLEFGCIYFSDSLPDESWKDACEEGFAPFDNLSDDMHLRHFGCRAESAEYFPESIKITHQFEKVVWSKPYYSTLLTKLVRRNLLLKMNLPSIK